MTVVSSHGEFANAQRLDAHGEAKHVRVLRTAEDLADSLAPWCALGNAPIEGSICAAPEWLGPMFRHLHPHRDGAMVLAVANDAGLEAVVPVMRSSWRWGFPVACLSSWANDFFFAGVPLVSGDNPQAVIQTALAGAREQTGARVMLFHKLTADGAFVRSLEETARRNGLACARIEPFERACLVTGRDYETWLCDTFKRKRRKEFRRLHARLSEQGALVCESLQADGDLKHWTDQFLDLEKAGWKGRRGTALACGGDMTAFLQATLPLLNDAGKLVFWRLSLDGRPVAMLFAMRSQRQAWLGKIAFDEDFARFSPGVLLVLEATRDLLARDDIDLVDSSAIPDHPMINHVWRDRLAVCDVLIATPGTAPVVFDLVHFAERSRRRLRALAKRAYHKFLKGRAT